MDNAPSELRQLIREELDMLLAEQDVEEARPSPSRSGRILRGIQRGLELMGAVLLGIICGVVSHVGVFLLERALR